MCSVFNSDILAFTLTKGVRINLNHPISRRSPGLNGSFELNAGYPHNYGGSANINFRKGKVNFFTGIGVQYSQRPGIGKSFQQFFLEDTTFAYERTRKETRGGLSGNGRFGVDYLINDKKTRRPSRGCLGGRWWRRFLRLIFHNTK